MSRCSSSPSPSPPRSPTTSLRRSSLANNSDERTPHVTFPGAENGVGTSSHAHTHTHTQKKRTSSRSAGHGRRLSAGAGAGSGKSPHLRHSIVLEYPASASSQVGISDDNADKDGFMFVNGDDTEVELSHRRKQPVAADGSGGDGSTAGHSKSSKGVGLGLRDGPSQSSRPTITPAATARSAKRVPPDVASHPLPARITLLPRTFRVFGHSYTLTRKRCEDLLLLSALVSGIVKLGYAWGEWALVGELSTLLILSVAYISLRLRHVIPLPPSPTQPTMRRTSSFWSALRARDRPRRGATTPANRNASPRQATQSVSDDETTLGVGGRGCIWGTEEREYRECLDDGALFALLLAPLCAAGLLHGAMTRLASEPDVATLPGWVIEPPLVIPNTPIRRISEGVPHGVNDAIRALSALAISRRNLVQLFTLLSFVLLVQLTWSLRHEVRSARRSAPSATTTPPMNSLQLGDATDHEAEPKLGPSPGTYWLRQGEARRNLSVIVFAFVVTAGCVVVKIVTAYIDYGVWSDMSHSDIVIATLFYQFCLYVCVRLARRGFTFGELGIVSHAATALFMETVNLTRTKLPILRTPYIKTYRLPTPLLTFQLALIPGSMLTGFLLSPLLYLSRHLAQRPVHRLRFPHEKPIHRRLLALAFYAGALLVVTGVVGVWAQWCLGWRNPYVWVVFFLLEGKHAWTRPVLISYWAALALFSVAAWQRQLSRARRHRRYTVPGRGEQRERADRAESASSTSTLAGPPSAASVSLTSQTPGVSAVATQMMDAADQRIPTLSVNARRKSFHALAVAMFIPGIAVDPAFTHLSFSVAFAAFTFAEYIRYFALWPLGASVHLFLNEFIDHKDSGTAILSHFYLLSGCATPLWFEGPSQIMAFFGILSLGIGDAVASIVGRRIGYARWSGASGKTAEGSAGFVASVVATAVFLWLVGAVESFGLVPFVITTILTTLMEAFSAQNDNLVLPVYGWAVGVLLGV